MIKNDTSCSANSLCDASAKNSNGGFNNSSLTSNNGKQVWLVASKLHEIGGPRQREIMRTFASQEGAKTFFAEQAAGFIKMIGKLMNTAIEQSDTELLIHIEGVQIIKMSCLAVPFQRA